MNTKEFVHWMRGFVTACPRYAPTPEQWDLLIETLNKVKVEEQLQTDQPTSARGVPYPTYPEKPQVWYSNTAGTPPDYMMGYASPVDNQVDKILKG